MTYIAVISGRARTYPVIFQADDDVQAERAAREMCDLGEELVACGPSFWEIVPDSPVVGQQREPESGS